MISFFLVRLIFDSVAILQGDIVDRLFWQSSSKGETPLKNKNFDLVWNTFAYL